MMLRWPECSRNRMTTAGMPTLQSQGEVQGKDLQQNPGRQRLGPAGFNSAYPGFHLSSAVAGGRQTQHRRAHTAQCLHGYTMLAFTPSRQPTVVSLRGAGHKLLGSLMGQEVCQFAC